MSNRIQASKPSFSKTNITLRPSTHVSGFGLIRGPNGAAEVQATHRVGGNIDADNNYITLTLASRFLGTAGNSINVTITHPGSNRVRYRPGSNLIEIRHAANSLAGVKAAVDASDNKFVVSSAVTGQGAQLPAPYTEHGSFSGGVDAIPNTYRKVMLGTSQVGTANADIQLIKSKSAAAPVTAATNYIALPRFAFPMIIDLDPDEYLYARRGTIGTNTGDVITAWFDEYTGEALVNFTPDITPRGGW